MPQVELTAPGKIVRIGWVPAPEYVTRPDLYFVRWEHQPEDSDILHVYEHSEPDPEEAVSECARIVNSIWHAAHPKAHPNL